MTTAAMAPGWVIANDFVVRSRLGEGGMGSVWVAEQKSTGKLRALKVMHREIVADAVLARRFVQEAKIGARIQSEHVVEVVAAGIDEASGTPYLVMELLEGADLRARLATAGPMAPALVVGVLEQICHAMAAAHEASVVHRDLKPENIFLARSRRAGGPPFMVKVLDFGIAKFVAEASTRATRGTVGSPMWMAPEQTSPGPVGPPADVWALGLVAYEMLTARSFWRTPNAEGGTTAQLLREIVLDPIPVASARAAEQRRGPLPPWFDTWFARCIEREPANRYADAAEAWAALRRVSGAGPSSDDALAMTQAAAFDAASTGAATTVPPRVISRPPSAMAADPREDGARDGEPRVGSRGDGQPRDDGEPREGSAPRVEDSPGLVAAAAGDARATDTDASRSGVHDDAALRATPGGLVHDGVVERSTASSPMPVSWGRNPVVAAVIVAGAVLGAAFMLTRARADRSEADPSEPRSPPVDVASSSSAPAPASSSPQAVAALDASPASDPSSPVQAASDAGPSASASSPVRDGMETAAPRGVAPKAGRASQPDKPAAGAVGGVQGGFTDPVPSTGRTAGAITTKVGEGRVRLLTRIVSNESNVTDAVVRRAIDHWPEGYTLCFIRHASGLKEIPEGTVTVRFEIIDQLPRHGAIVSSTIGNKAIEDCVVNTLLGLTINAAGPEGSGSVVYGFRFLRN